MKFYENDERKKKKLTLFNVVHKRERIISLVEQFNHFYCAKVSFREKVCDYIVLFELVICLLVALQGTSPKLRFIQQILSGNFAI